MGQIKNIKLHIVTDIKETCHNKKRKAAMFDRFIGMKSNIFGSPFAVASCSNGEAPAVQKPRSNMMAAAEGYSCEFGSGVYYAYCGFGGVLSCGITHTAVVPLDLVKCRIQVDPGKYTGIFQAGGLTIKEEGLRGLTKGWAPTLIGYSMQDTNLYDTNTSSPHPTYYCRGS